MKRPVPAPIVNPQLAAMLSREPNPLEDLVSDQGQAITAFVFMVGTADTLTKQGRPVVLACGHYAMTKALYKARCPRCGEMIRAGYDYDAFRNLGHPDTFSWPDDPFRELHESDVNEARFVPI